MFFRILYHQARHRWGLTLLLFLAMTALVGLYVYSLNSSRFQNRSMQLVMKNLGHNMLILPKAADPAAVFRCSEDQLPFSQEVTHRLAANLRVASRYYVSILQKWVPLNGSDVILTGMEVVPRSDESEEKHNLIDPLEVGKARLGSEAAKRLKMGVGDSVQVEGRSFQVERVIEPKGTMDDYRLYIPLAACQEILGRPGEINVIWAFMCLMGRSLEQVEKYQTRELGKAEPDFQHVSETAIAVGRFQVRDSTRRSLTLLQTFSMVLMLLIIAIGGFQEATDRRRELGIFTALGTDFYYVAGLCLLKMILLAVVAGLAGFWIGSMLAVKFTTPFVIVETESVRILWEDLPGVLGLVCLTALLAMIPPMIQLHSVDPNSVLVEE